MYTLRKTVDAHATSLLNTKRKPFTLQNLLKGMDVYVCTYKSTYKRAPTHTSGRLLHNLVACCMRRNVLTMCSPTHTQKEAQMHLEGSVGDALLVLVLMVSLVVGVKLARHHVHAPAQQERTATRRRALVWTRRKREQRRGEYHICRKAWSRKTQENFGKDRQCSQALN